MEYQGKADLARFWLSDWDNDGTAYGVEYALGRDPLAGDPSSSALEISVPVSGVPSITFEIATPPVADVEWIIRRSLDLSALEEIYRSASPEVADGKVTVEDPAASGFDRAFYKFEAAIAP